MTPPTTPRTDHSTAPAGAAAIGGGLAMVCVGGSVAVSGILEDAPLATAQSLRYGIAALVLFALAAGSGNRIRAPLPGDWPWLIGTCLSGLVLFNVALVRGSEHAEPAALAVAVACVPVVLALAGPLVGGAKPGRRLVTAAVVVTAGAVLVQGVGRTDAVGVAWAVLVLACEAGFTLLAVPLLERHGAWGVSVHTTWLAALAFGVWGVLVEGPGAVTRLGAADLSAVAYLALVVTALAFLLWYSCVRRIGAGRAGLLTGVAPVSAAAIGVALGAGVPSLGVWAGTLLVAAGLALGFGRRRRTRILRGPERGHDKPGPGAGPQRVS